MAEEETNNDGVPDLSESGVRARVDHIADLMRRHSWKGRTTTRALSEAWSLSPSTIQNYSSEASRIVVSELPSGEEAKAGFLAMAEAIRDEALKSGAFGPALDTVKFSAQLCGLMPATKTKAEVSGPDGGPVQMAGVVVLPALDAGPEDDG